MTKNSMIRLCIAFLSATLMLAFDIRTPMVHIPQSSVGTHPPSSAQPKRANNPRRPVLQRTKALWSHHYSFSSYDSPLMTSPFGSPLLHFPDLYENLPIDNTPVDPVQFVCVTVALIFDWMAGVTLERVCASIRSMAGPTEKGSSSKRRDDERRSVRMPLPVRSNGGWGGIITPSDRHIFRFFVTNQTESGNQARFGPFGENTETTSAVNDNVNDNDPEMGFLEATIRHVFGVGDPNRERNFKRLQLASAMIRENNGVVTAEQLAPFCDAPPPGGDGDEQLHVDESSVLPIVSKLYGVPSVTDDGNIVYTFSELQTSAQ
eukprot:CAMPEP_0194365454 /NCGR_PEP_ID=MMETSP0174-20130528/13508_1 /TAXON_ID=216777 /ORGANISM="Proboscia alata, Strain PI-D3" /LENGTH=318 /DNA_ID=CAMNT_0039140159 /DNA_START=127 /DNA_END=1080 /DNA_ORIENTATION=+